MRALLDHIFSHANVMDHDIAGAPILRFEFVCAPCLMDKLSSFNALLEDLEADPDEASG